MAARSAFLAIWPRKSSASRMRILIPPDRHNEETAILERLRRGDRINSYETVRRHKDGSPVNVSLTVSPLKNTEGRVIGASKIARNITERLYATSKRSRHDPARI